MNAFYAAILLIVLLEGVHSYSKFGRKCDDIGCASNEECVMASKPCSYFDRKDECGEYPTCKRTGSGTRTCDTYVCPPSKVCKMDGGIPKCFDDSSQVGKVSIYDTSNLNNKYDGHSGQAQPSAPVANHNPSAPSGNHNPSAPSGNYNPGHSNPSGGSLYPNIGGGGNNYQGGYNNPGYQQPAGGYQQPAGGYQQPAGGYQRPSGNYGGYQQPQNNYGGYPGYNRPAGGYGQQNVGYGGYNQGGGNRPQQQGGVPTGYHVAGAGYQQPGTNNNGYGSYNNRPQNNGYGYNQGYGGYGTNNGYGNNGYGQGQQKTKSSGSSFTDSLKDALKKIGLLILVSQYIGQNYWR